MGNRWYFATKRRESSEPESVRLDPGEALRVVTRGLLDWELYIVRPHLDGKSYDVVRSVYRSRSGDRCCDVARRHGWRGNGRPHATLPVWSEVGQVEPGELQPAPGEAKVTSE